jgi:aflatoxin B1 aldehyde reductase
MLGFLKATSVGHVATGSSKPSKQEILGKRYRDLYGEEKLREAHRTLVEAIQPLAISGVEAAVRWICYHSALDRDDGVIFGASTISQIEETLQAVKKGPLPEATALQLEQVYRILDGV